MYAYKHVFFPTHAHTTYIYTYTWGLTQLWFPKCVCVSNALTQIHALIKASVQYAYIRPFIRTSTYKQARLDAHILTCYVNLQMHMLTYWNSEGTHAECVHMFKHRICDRNFLNTGIAHQSHLEKKCHCNAFLSKDFAQVDAMNFQTGHKFRLLSAITSLVGYGFEWHPISKKIFKSKHWKSTTNWWTCESLARSHGSHDSHGRFRQDLTVRGVDIKNDAWHSCSALARGRGL